MIFHINDERSLGAISILILNHAIIRLFCHGGIRYQGIRIISFDFFIIQIPSIGKQIWIIGISIYFQLKRLTLFSTDSKAIPFLPSIRPDMKFLINTIRIIIIILRIIFFGRIR